MGAKKKSSRDLILDFKVWQAGRLAVTFSLF